VATIKHPVETAVIAEVIGHPIGCDDAGVRLLNVAVKFVREYSNNNINATQLPINSILQRYLRDILLGTSWNIEDHEQATQKFPQILKRASRFVIVFTNRTKKKNNLRGLQSASELYRLIDRHLSTNLVPTFGDRGMSRGQRGGSPTVVNLSYLDRSRYFSFK
jgi:hypothetical protein